MSSKASASAPKVSHSAGTPKVNRSPATPKTDRRVRRTRDLLGDALVELMHEKPFEAITVQHVLDRAGVGRSTFYSHYSNKDDLFLSDAEEFFELMSTLLSRRGEVSNRVAPVREFFAHVAEWRAFHSALVASSKLNDVLQLAHGHFARAIERRLAELPPARGISAGQRPAAAHAFAGALLSLLSWWINHGTPASPAQMDDLYHRMVWSGISVPAAHPSAQGEGVLRY
jgi:AcrR family transcriptional regulator